jgi:hypothetical protein
MATQKFQASLIDNAEDVAPRCEPEEIAPTHICTICGQRFGGQPAPDLPKRLRGFAPAIRHVKEKHPQLDFPISAVCGINSFFARQR